MQFCYFVEDTKATAQFSPERLESLGIGYAFDGKPLARHCLSGPTGKPGYTLSATSERLGYYPEQQTWTPLCDAQGVQVGYYTDDRPQPEKLARQEQLPGEWLEIDGVQWLVPVARRFAEVGNDVLPFISLPQSQQYIGAGKWEAGPVRPRYRRLWRLVETYWTELELALEKGRDLGNGTIEYTRPECSIQAACEAMKINYRVGPDEISIMQLIDDTTPSRILDIVLDNARLRSMLEKKTAYETPLEDGTTLSAGHEGITVQQPTGQPTPI